jgi:predicted aspartyl protease
VIIGRISNGYPLVSVTFRLPGQPDFQLECVVDTGFAGYVTLPQPAVEAMELSFFYQMVTNLANKLTGVRTDYAGSCCAGY